MARTHILMVLSGICCFNAVSLMASDEAPVAEEKGVLERLYEKSNDQEKQELEAFYRDVQQAVDEVQAKFDAISQEHKHVISRIKAEENTNEDIYLPLSVRLSDEEE